MSNPAKNTVCLWFDKDSEEAARFYAATFPDSSVDGVHLAPADNPSCKPWDGLPVLGNPSATVQIRWITALRRANFPAPCRGEQYPKLSGEYLPGGNTMPTGELLRSRDDRMLAGVCGGLAKWLGWDSTAVRVLYVLVSVFSAAFPGILVYIILALVMPLEE